LTLLQHLPHMSLVGRRIWRPTKKTVILVPVTVLISAVYRNNSLSPRVGTLLTRQLHITSESTGR